MNWPEIQPVLAGIEQPAGYRCTLLERSEVGELIVGLKNWYPGIEVGNASCFLRETFYREKVFFRGETDGDTIVFLFKRDDETVGMVAYERDRDSEVLYGRVGAVAPGHRGSRLGLNFTLLEESLGRAMGAGMVYALATLSVPNVQASAEQFGWDLIGITPGFDKEMIKQGVAKRVYEAVYAKVLVPDGDLLRPRANNLTPRTRALFDLLYPGKVNESEA